MKSIPSTIKVDTSKLFRPLVDNTNYVILREVSDMIWQRFLVEMLRSIEIELFDDFGLL